MKEILHTNPEARQLYAEYMSVFTHLRTCEGIAENQIPDDSGFDMELWRALADSEKTAESIEIQKPKEVFVPEDKEPVEKMPSKTSKFSIYSLILSSAALIFLILAGTVIMNTMMMVIFERISEIGTIGALGMKPRQISRLFLLEGFFLSVVGSIAGLILGLAVVIPFSVAGMNLGTDIEFGSASYAKVFPYITGSNIVFVFIFSVVVATFIAWIAARRSARIKPVEALRS